MLLDKLTTINQCLIATGNNPVTTDDGSPSWIAASTAYDRILPVVLYKHDWKFQTNTTNLTRLGASTYPGYEDIFAKPFDCLHLMNVWRTDLAQDVPVLSQFGIDGMQVTPPELDYKIIGDQIHTVAPNGATCLYEVDPTQHSEVILDISVGALETLRREIESALYQSLNEDAQGAEMTKKLAMEEMAEARQKDASEQPRRVAFRSNFLERRRRHTVGWWL